MAEQDMFGNRLQVKCNYDEGRMHIQGIHSGVKHGRPYGFAIKMRTAKDVTQWLRTQTATLKSAASGEVMYTAFDLLRYEDGTYQMFIPGEGANRDDGAILDMQPMDETVKQLIAFADEANLTTNVVGEGRWTPPVMGSPPTNEEEE
tara:strand:- start:1934 stop:2374 length:441 start_codon:yes stop_codon:yes gene_type:complete